MVISGSPVIKNLPAKAGGARNTGLIPGLGRSPGVENWQPTPEFLPGKFQGERSLEGYSPWGRKESDTTEWAQHSRSKPSAAIVSRPVVWHFATPWTTAHQASLFFTISRSLPKFMSIASMMPSSHLILWGPLLPSFFPNIRNFSNESVIHIRNPKYWSFNVGISPSNEYSGLITLKIDWFDLAVQGTLKSLLQQYSSKVS